MGRPFVMLLRAWQMGDDNGAASLIDAMPRAKTPIGDEEYDADWLRIALATRC